MDAVLDDPYMQPRAQTSLAWLPPDLQQRVGAMRAAHQRWLAQGEAEAPELPTVHDVVRARRERAEFFEFVKRRLAEREAVRARSIVGRYRSRGYRDFAGG